MRHETLQSDTPNGHKHATQAIPSVTSNDPPFLWRHYSQVVRWSVTSHVQTCSGRNHIIPLMWLPNTDSTLNKPVTLQVCTQLSWSKQSILVTQFSKKPHCFAHCTPCYAMLGTFCVDPTWYNSPIINTDGIQFTYKTGCVRLICVIKCYNKISNTFNQ